jgi:hypothetical protein
MPRRLSWELDARSTHRCVPHAAQPEVALHTRRSSAVLWSLDGPPCGKGGRQGHWWPPPTCPATDPLPMPLAVRSMGIVSSASFLWQVVLAIIFVVILAAVAPIHQPAS